MTIIALLLTPIVAAGVAFNCTPIRVWDGDGPIWCAEGPRVRLAGIAAREIDEQCKLGHPCPAATGQASRDQLVGLLGGARGRSPSGHIVVRAPTMRCVSRGHARGSRTAAFCQAPGKGDLSCAMLRSGTVVRWKHYDGDHVCNPRG